MNYPHSLPGKWLGVALLTASAAVGVKLHADTETGIDYSDPDTWLCRPDNLRACDVDLTTTVVHADGTLQREIHHHNPAAPVDCFYVYPTVSQDSTPNSDMDAGPEEYNVIRSQFARMGSQCRLFAPLYRQVTLTALRASMAGESSLTPDRTMPYEDVRNAWNHYLEQHNDGRGVVLVGHSQGAGVLSRLIANEIEGTDTADQLISAMIIGSTVQVPEGQLSGGTFQQFPLCQSGDETGCIISYASFRDEIPPSSASLFGRGGNGTVAACTNPAQLARNQNELHAYLSNQAAVGFDSTGPGQWTTTGERIETPFVSVPGLLHGECVERDGFRYLEVSIQAAPDDARTDEVSGDVMNPDGSVNAGWGLHLIDMNLGMGDLVEIIARQSASYLASQ